MRLLWRKQYALVRVHSFVGILVNSECQEQFYTPASNHQIIIGSEPNLIFSIRANKSAGAGWTAQSQSIRISSGATVIVHVCICQRARCLQCDFAR